MIPVPLNLCKKRFKKAKLATLSVVYTFTGMSLCLCFIPKRFKCYKVNYINTSRIKYSLKIFIYHTHIKSQLGDSVYVQCLKFPTNNRYVGNI